MSQLQLPGGQDLHPSDASRGASWPPGQGRQAEQLLVLAGERRQETLEDEHFQEQPSPPKPALTNWSLQGQPRQPGNFAILWVSVCLQCSFSHRITEW